MGGASRIAQRREVDLDPGLDVLMGNFPLDDDQRAVERSLDIRHDIVAVFRAQGLVVETTHS